MQKHVYEKTHSYVILKSIDIKYDHGLKIEASWYCEKELNEITEIKHKLQYDHNRNGPGLHC